MGATTAWAAIHISVLGYKPTWMENYALPYFAAASDDLFCTGVALVEYLLAVRGGCICEAGPGACHCSLDMPLARLTRVSYSFYAHKAQDGWMDGWMDDDKNVLSLPKP